MTSTPIAHVRKSDGMPQSVASHLTETAAIARLLAGKLGLAQVGELLGLMHDFGKYSADFQEYIKAATGLNPDVDVEDTLPDGKKIDHSTAGAQWVYRRLKKFGAEKGIGELFGQILGLCIASHHGEGLIDCLDEVAAFRRLCVETSFGGISSLHLTQPPTGGCVLEHYFRPCRVIFPV